MANRILVKKGLLPNEKEEQRRYQSLINSKIRQIELHNKESAGRRRKGSHEQEKWEWEERKNPYQNTLHLGNDHIGDLLDNLKLDLEHRGMEIDPVPEINHHSTLDANRHKGLLEQDVEKILFGDSHVEKLT